MSQAAGRTRTVAPVVIGLLAILSVGMAAATLDTAQNIGGGESDLFQPPEAGQPIGGEPNQGPNRGGEPGEPPESQDGLQLELSYCIEFLASSLGTGLVVLGFFGIVGAVYARYSFSAALLGGWTILPPILLVYFLLTNCGGSDQTNTPGGGNGRPEIGNSLVGASEVPTWAIGAFVAVVLVGAVGLLYWTASEDEAVVAAQDEEDVEGEPALDEFANAAGRAADRIEKHNADVDNAVYRAWLEMTNLLEVENRNTYSPVDFAEEAVSLGMNEDDVNELTTLFNEVRYGHMDAESREDRAVSVLRNIESQYSGEVDVDDAATGADETSADDMDGDQR